MRVVVDTNVLISGVFFGGVPSRILEAWRDEKFELVVSPGIVEEYRRVGEKLADQFPNAWFIEWDSTQSDIHTRS